MEKNLKLIFVKENHVDNILMNIIFYNRINYNKIYNFLFNPFLKIMNNNVYHHMFFIFKILFRFLKNQIMKRLL